MLEKIKNYIIGIVLILLLISGVSFFKGCFGPKLPSIDSGKPAIIVKPAKTAVPTKEDLKNVPSDHTIITVIKPSVTPISSPWEKIDTKIIIHKDSKCNSCVAEYTEVLTAKKYIGFSFKSKFVLGYADSKILPGLGLEFFRIGKYSSDLLVSFPYAGLGLSYNITNGFFIGAGADIRYLNYREFSDIGSYSFGTNMFNNIYPQAHLGFHF